MGKKNESPPAADRRRWRLLRLALLWARKGAAFKKRLFLDFKNLRRPDRLHYRDRQFSFDDTPTFPFNIRRPSSLRLPRIPCFIPSASFDDDEEIFIERHKAMKLLEEAAGCKENERNDEIDVADTSCSTSDVDMGAVEEGEEIDSRAESFIMEFYKQLKLQRQISYLQYNEMVHSGMSS